MLTWILVFLTLKSPPQPEIKVYLKFRFNPRSVLLEFQSFTEKSVFECAFAHPIMLFSSHLVINSMDRVSVICQLAMEMVSNAHVRQLCLFNVAVVVTVVIAISTCYCGHCCFLFPGFIYQLVARCVVS